MLSVAFFSHGQGRAGGSIEWIRKIGESSGKNPLFSDTSEFRQQNCYEQVGKSFHSKINPAEDDACS